MNTYYCTLQWNTAHEAGGYCGIQSHPHGHNYIFSLWNSRSHAGTPIRIPYKGHGTTTHTFGGEGTGMQAMNYSLGWKDHHWYTTVMRQWDHEQHSRFGFWVHDQSARKWEHLVTMEYPVHANFVTTTGCFLEDWAGSGQHQREVHFRHGFKRRTDHTWLPFNTSHFRVIQEAGTKDHNDNYNAGVQHGYYFMQSGGKTTPSPGLGTYKTIHNYSTPSHPPNKPIHFTITSATSSQVTWHVDESETPQFSFSVTVDRNPYPAAADVDPEKRSVQLKVGTASEVEATLEDLLGNRVTKSMVIHWIRRTITFWITIVSRCIVKRKLTKYYNYNLTIKLHTHRYGFMKTFLFST